MKKIKKFIIISILLLILMPVVSFAKLVPDCSSTGCGWTEFMNLINEVIRFVLFKMAIPIAAIMFFYAGFLMVTSGGSPESKTKAKGIFSNAVWGLVIAAAAWLIIRTILSILGYDGAWIGFPKL